MDEHGKRIVRRRIDSEQGHEPVKGGVHEDGASLMKHGSAVNPSTLTNAAQPGGRLAAGSGGRVIQSGIQAREG